MIECRTTERWTVERRTGNVKQGISNFLKHQTTERQNAQRQTTERGNDWTSNFPASDAQRRIIERRNYPMLKTERGMGQRRKCLTYYDIIWTPLCNNTVSLIWCMYGPHPRCLLSCEQSIIVSAERKWLNAWEFLYIVWWTGSHSI
jgi:hypothetical protein